MANYHAIAVTGEALVGLLKAACPRPEFQNVSFELYQPADIIKRDMSKDTVSLYLYRVAVNTSRRNLPPRFAPDGRKLRPSLPLDLFYALTVWSGNAATAQGLLGWCMRALEDTPILPSGLLNHYGPDGHTFKDEEAVEIITEPLTLGDMANLWEGFKPNVQLSVGYVARQVIIDSELTLTEAAGVQTRSFDFGKVAGTGR